jgi:pSer/pThr/pTyr-binding forkhead associated (FHA) protein
VRLRHERRSQELARRIFGFCGVTHVGIDGSVALSERHESRAIIPGTAGTGRGPRDAGVLPAGSATLLLTRGPGAGSRFPLDHDTTLIGRSDTDIVLDGVTVSRCHAEVRRHGTSFVVVDVGSFNGTYLNRSPVDSAVLADGDEIQVGKFRLVFQAATGRVEGPSASPSVPTVPRR